jgi:hypothetical protein
MTRRGFLGLLVAAGFRLQAEPTVDLSQVNNRVFVQGVGPDYFGPWLTRNEVRQRELGRQFTIEDVAFLYDVPVSLLERTR